MVFFVSCKNSGCDSNAVIVQHRRNHEAFGQLCSERASHLGDLVEHRSGDPEHPTGEPGERSDSSPPPDTISPRASTRSSSNVARSVGKVGKRIDAQNRSPYGEFEFESVFDLEV